MPSFKQRFYYYQRPRPAPRPAGVPARDRIRRGDPASLPYAPSAPARQTQVPFQGGALNYARSAFGAVRQALYGAPPVRPIAGTAADHNPGQAFDYAWPVPVGVNVYQLVGGLPGVYHTALRIGDADYAWGQQGITAMTAGDAGEMPHARYYPLPAYQGPHGVLRRRLTNAFVEFAQQPYAVVGHNCNDFVEFVLRRVFGLNMPANVNRAANLAGTAAGLAPYLPMAGAALSWLI